MSIEVYIILDVFVLLSPFILPLMVPVFYFNYVSCEQ